MAQKLSVNLGVEGESELKNALKDINQEFKVLSSEMTLTTSEFGKNEQSVEALSAKNEVLNKQIELQKEKVDTLGSALENSTEKYGENDKRTQDWQIQLNKAQAELNNMERELENNTTAIDEMSAETTESTQSVTEIGEEAEETGSKFAGMGDALKNAGATIVAGLAAMGTAVVDAGKKLFDMATDAAAAGDRIDKTSQKLGLSASGFQEWEFVLSHNGASIESMSAGLKKLNDTVDDVNNGNDAATEKFERLGISLDDLKGKSREEIFNLTIEGLQGITDEGEKAAIAGDLLGKSAVELGPLLNQTAEATAELKQQANDLGIVMSDDAVAASAVYTDSMDNMTRTMNGFKNKIGAEMLPGLSMIVDGLTGVIAGSDDASEQIKNGAVSIVESITGILPQIMSVVMSLIDTLATVAPDIIATLVTGIVDNLPKLLEMGVKLITELTKGISQTIPHLVKAIPDIILALINALLDAIPQLITTGIELITSIIQDLPGIIKIIVEKLPDIISAIIKALLDNLPLLVDAGITLFTAIITALPEIIIIIVKQLPTIIKSIVDTFIAGVPNIVGAGKNLIYGLWNGIASVADWLREKISGFFNGVVNSIKSFFGIKSPSTLFRDQIGKNLALGLGEGISDEMQKVTQDAKKEMQTLTDTMSGKATFELDTQMTSANTQSAILASLQDNQNKQLQTIITIEPTQDLRGFFEYLSTNIKRVEYLNGY